MGFRLNNWGGFAAIMLLAWDVVAWMVGLGLVLVFNRDV